MAGVHQNGQYARPTTAASQPSGEQEYKYSHGEDWEELAEQLRTARGARAISPLLAHTHSPAARLFTYHPPKQRYVASKDVEFFDTTRLWTTKNSPGHPAIFNRHLFPTPPANNDVQGPTFGAATVPTEALAQTPPAPSERLLRSSNAASQLTSAISRQPFQISDQPGMLRDRLDSIMGSERQGQPGRASLDCDGGATSRKPGRTNGVSGSTGDAA